MIISHIHRYLFIQLPHAGSTAIGTELLENYAGQAILHKHAHYLEFLRIASPEEKTYFVFSSIRNPLDEAVSIYTHFKTNPYQRFTNPQKRTKQGGWIDDYTADFYQWFARVQPDFSTFFRHFYKLPYDNLSCLAHRQFDYIIRFENLQADFSEVLKRLGLEQKRPLPRVNPTKNREADFLSYYPPTLWAEAKHVFGPFMRQWGYQFPPDWGDMSPSWSSQLQFQVLGWGRQLYYRYLKVRSNTPARLIGETAKRWLKSGFVRTNSR